jgi:hypothetical protein
MKGLFKLRSISYVQYTDDLKVNFKYKGPFSSDETFDDIYGRYADFRWSFLTLAREEIRFINTYCQVIYYL